MPINYLKLRAVLSGTDGPGVSDEGKRYSDKKKITAKVYIVTQGRRRIWTDADRYLTSMLAECNKVHSGSKDTTPRDIPENIESQKACLANLFATVTVMVSR